MIKILGILLLALIMFCFYDNYSVRRNDKKGITNVNYKIITFNVSKPYSFFLIRRRIIYTSGAEDLNGILGFQLNNDSVVLCFFLNSIILNLKYGN